MFLQDNYLNIRMVLLYNYIDSKKEKNTLNFLHIPNNTNCYFYTIPERNECCIVVRPKTINI